MFNNNISMSNVTHKHFTQNVSNSVICESVVPTGRVCPCVHCCGCVYPVSLGQVVFLQLFQISLQMCVIHGLRLVADVTSQLNQLCPQICICMLQLCVLIYPASLLGNVSEGWCMRNNIKQKQYFQLIGHKPFNI